MPLDKDIAQTLANTYAGTSAEQKLVAENLAALLLAADTVVDGAVTVEEKVFMLSPVLPTRGISRYASSDNRQSQSRRSSVMSERDSSTTGANARYDAEKAIQRMISGKLQTASTLRTSRYLGRSDSFDANSQSTASLQSIPVEESARLEKLVQQAKRQAEWKLKQAKIDSNKNDIEALKLQIVKLEQDISELYVLSVKNKEELSFKERKKLEESDPKQLEIDRVTKVDKLSTAKSQRSRLETETHNLEQQLAREQQRIGSLLVNDTTSGRAAAPSASSEASLHEGLGELVVSIGGQQIKGFDLKSAFDAMEQYLRTLGYAELKAIAATIPDAQREELMLTVLQLKQQAADNNGKSLSVIFNNLPSKPWREALGFPVDSQNLEKSENLRHRLSDLDAKADASKERKADARAEGKKMQGKAKGGGLSAYAARLMRKFAPEKFADQQPAADKKPKGPKG